MATINRTDRLYVTIHHGGSKPYTIEMSGLTSLGEVYRQVKGFSNVAAGVVTLHLRNSTQGWTQQHNIVLKSKAINNAAVPSGKMSMTSYPSLFDSII